MNKQIHKHVFLHSHHVSSTIDKGKKTVKVPGVNCAHGAHKSQNETHPLQAIQQVFLGQADLCLG